MKPSTATSQVNANDSISQVGHQLKFQQGSPKRKQPD